MNNLIVAESAAAPKRKQLRPYQHDAITAARDIICQNYFPVVVAPTGAGKSAIAANIIKLCLEKGGRVLIIVNLEPLIDQFYQTCFDWLDFSDLEKVGLMAGDRPIRPAYSSDDRGKDKWKVLRR